MNQSKTISDLLAERNHQWRIEDGRYVTPDESDVRILLEKMHDRLMSEDNMASIETGGILMRNENGNIDVFCYLGTLDNNPPVD